MSAKSIHVIHVSSQNGLQFLLRQALLIISLFAVFSLIGGNLISLAVLKNEDVRLARAAPLGVHKVRPDIVDRTGALLATDIEAPSLYANPSGLMEPAKVIKKLKTALPDLDEVDLLRQMTLEKRQFVFIKRGMHPRLAQKVFDMGLPGVNVTKEVRRVYPKGSIGGYVLGHVDIDNIGRSGIEKYIDEAKARGDLGFQKKSLKPIALSLNVAANHVLQDELAHGLREFKAKFAAGLVMNVRTGEIVAHASLPVADPQTPSLLLDKDRFDRIAGGVFELGSVFKTITTAMVLEKGVVDLDSQVDVSKPLNFGQFTIRDYHPHKGDLSVADIFVRSSNIGTAKLAAKLSTNEHKSFLKRMRLLDPLQTELGLMRKAETVEKWGGVHSATISYGHGIAITPLQFTSAVSALVNGGIYVPPTFLKRSLSEAKDLGERVVSERTSEQIRRLLRQNVTDPEGTASRAAVSSYRVGGKTGTANKVVKRKYSKEKVLTSFVGIFPAERPEYIVFLMLDEPQATKASRGLTVAGLNVAPLTGRVISRLAPLLKVRPVPTYKDQVAISK